MRRSLGLIFVSFIGGWLLVSACSKKEDAHADAKPELASAVTPADSVAPAEPEVEGSEVVVDDGVGGKVAIRTEARPPAGHPRDFFPSAPGTRWAYDVELGDDDPLLYEEVSWPVGAPGDGKSMVTAVRGRLEGSLDETRRPMRLELAVAGPAERQGPLRYPHGVELTVVRDDAGAFRGCKNAYWAMTESGRFSANLVLMYDRSSSGAPGGGGLGWGEWGQADGHSTRLVFFVDEPGISISVSESPDSLLFTGIDRKREGCEESECLRFVRVVKASGSEESGEPSYLDNAFREDIWFARGKGLVRLEQTVGGKRTMTWKLASFRPGRQSPLYLGSRHSPRPSSPATAAPPRNGKFSRSAPTACRSAWNACESLPRTGSAHAVTRRRDFRPLLGAARCSCAEMTTMTEHHFEAEITGKLQADADALRERVYETNGGMVRVEAVWPEANEGPSMRVPLHVVDARENGDARDIPAFVELFFHDAFLIFNLATPGSFGGVIATSGGELRVRELTLESQLFDVVASSSKRLPLADVVRWYDAQHLGTQQVAATPVAKALFHLLHLARTPESDWLTVLHLAHAAEALGVASNAILELLESIAGGVMPVLHPMHDDALDPRVDEGAVAMLDAIDDTMRAIVAELQARAGHA